MSTGEVCWACSPLIPPSHALAVVEETFLNNWIHTSGSHQLPTEPTAMNHIGQTRSFPRFFPNISWTAFSFSLWIIAAFSNLTQLMWRKYYVHLPQQSLTHYICKIHTDVAEATRFRSSSRQRSTRRGQDELHLAQPLSRNCCFQVEET